MTLRTAADGHVYYADEHVNYYTYVVARDSCPWVLVVEQILLIKIKLVKCYKNEISVESVFISRKFYGSIISTWITERKTIMT